MISGFTEEMPCLGNLLPSTANLFHPPGSPYPRNSHRIKTYDAVPVSSVALKLWENHKPQRTGPLRNYILPKNLILDMTTRERIQRQIDLGRHQDPAAVIAYA